MEIEAWENDLSCKPQLCKHSRMSQSKYSSNWSKSLNSCYGKITFSRDFNRHKYGTIHPRLIVDSPINNNNYTADFNQSACLLMYRMINWEYIWVPPTRIPTGSTGYLCLARDSIADNTGTRWTTKLLIISETNSHNYLLLGSTHMALLFTLHGWMPRLIATHRCTRNIYCCTSLWVLHHCFEDGQGILCTNPNARSIIWYWMLIECFLKAGLVLDRDWNRDSYYGRLRANDKRPITNCSCWHG